MPSEKSREAAVDVHAPHPFIRYLLLGLLVAGLVLAARLNYCSVSD